MKQHGTYGMTVQWFNFKYFYSSGNGTRRGQVDPTPKSSIKGHNFISVTFLLITTQKCTCYSVFTHTFKADK